jgi:hypothetical protein
MAIVLNRLGTIPVFFGVTEENHGNQLGWLMSRPKSENRSANHVIFALVDIAWH